MENLVKSGIFGICVGDALGVPVEFKKREDLKRARSQKCWNTCHGISQRERGVMTAH